MLMLDCVWRGIRHGTRCAGEVAAEANNKICNVGVAYDARIGGNKLLGLVVCFINM